MPISRVFMIVDRYESGYGHGWKQDGFDLSKTPHSNPELAEAYDLGYKAGHDARERWKMARPGVARMVRKWKQEKPAAPETERGDCQNTAVELVNNSLGCAAVCAGCGREIKNFVE